MAALVAAAERGVEIQIITDGLTGLLRMGGNDHFAALDSYENVEIRLYNPLNILDVEGLHCRLHDKYLIVDGTYCPPRRAEYLQLLPRRLRERARELRPGGALGLHRRRERDHCPGGGRTLTGSGVRTAPNRCRKRRMKRRKRTPYRRRRPACWRGTRGCGSGSRRRTRILTISPPAARPAGSP